MTLSPRGAALAGLRRLCLWSATILPAQSTRCSSSTERTPRGCRCETVPPTAPLPAAPCRLTLAHGADDCSPADLHEGGDQPAPAPGNGGRQDGNAKDDPRLRHRGCGGRRRRGRPAPAPLTLPCLPSPQGSCASPSPSTCCSSQAGARRASSAAATCTRSPPHIWSASPTCPASPARSSGAAPLPAALQYLSHPPHPLHPRSRYRSLFKMVDLANDFYFSYSYDLTNTLQHNMSAWRGCWRGQGVVQACASAHSLILPSSLQRRGSPRAGQWSLTTASCGTSSSSKAWPCPCRRPRRARTGSSPSAAASSARSVRSQAPKPPSRRGDATHPLVLRTHSRPDSGRCPAPHDAPGAPVQPLRRHALPAPRRQRARRRCQ